MTRDRHDPASPKANPHWAAMFLAKRRALDRVILAEAERSIAAEEEPSLDQDAKAVIARAFGRPIK